MSKDAASRIFSKGLNCAQSVLAAKSDITGAYMVIGALHGRVNPDDSEARDRTYSLISEFNKRFIEIHGSLSCRELLDVDLKTDEGMDEAKSLGYFEKKCTRYVEDAEKILDDILPSK